MKKITLMVLIVLISFGGNAPKALAQSAATDLNTLTIKVEPTQAKTTQPEVANPVPMEKRGINEKRLEYSGDHVSFVIIPEVVTPQKPNPNQMSKADKVLYNPDAFEPYLKWDTTSSAMSQFRGTVAVSLYLSMEDNIQPSLKGRQCSNTPGHVAAQFLRLNAASEVDTQMADVFSTLQTCAEPGRVTQRITKDPIGEAFQSMRDFQELTKRDRILAIQKAQQELERKLAESER